MKPTGDIKDCIIDGPLNVFLAHSSKSIEIKGLDTIIRGGSDVLSFSSIESCNPFYIGLIKGTAHSYMQ